MSSFKQKNSATPQMFQKPIQRVQSARGDVQSYATLTRTLLAEEKSLPSIPVHQNGTTQLQQTGNPAPSQNHTQGFTTHKPMRAMSEKHSPAYNGQTLNRHTNMNSLPEATSNLRHRTTSAGSTRQEIAQKIHQVKTSAKGYYFCFLSTHFVPIPSAFRKFRSHIFMLLCNMSKMFVTSILFVIETGISLRPM